MCSQRGGKDLRMDVYIWLAKWSVFKMGKAKKLILLYLEHSKECRPLTS